VPLSKNEIIIRALADPLLPQRSGDWSLEKEKSEKSLKDKKANEKRYRLLTNLCSFKTYFSQRIILNQHIHSLVCYRYHLAEVRLH